MVSTQAELVLYPRGMTLSHPHEALSLTGNGPREERPSCKHSGGFRLESVGRTVNFPPKATVLLFVPHRSISPHRFREKILIFPVDFSF